MPILYITDDFFTRSGEEGFVCDIAIVMARQYKYYSDDGLCMLIYEFHMDCVRGCLLDGKGVFSLTLEAAENKLKKKGLSPPYKVANFL